MSRKSGYKWILPVALGLSGAGQMARSSFAQEEPQAPAGINVAARPARSVVLKDMTVTYGSGGVLGFNVSKEGRSEKSDKIKIEIKYKEGSEARPYVRTGEIFDDGTSFISSFSASDLDFKKLGEATTVELSFLEKTGQGYKPISTETYRVEDFPKKLLLTSSRTPPNKGAKAEPKKHQTPAAIQPHSKPAAASPQVETKSLSYEGLFGNLTVSYKPFSSGNEFYFQLEKQTVREKPDMILLTIKDDKGRPVGAYRIESNDIFDTPFAIRFSYNTKSFNPRENNVIELSLQQLDSDGAYKPFSIVEYKGLGLGLRKPTWRILEKSGLVSRKDAEKPKPSGTPEKRGPAADSTATVSSRSESSKKASKEGVAEKKYRFELEFERLERQRTEFEEALKGIYRKHNAAADASLRKFENYVTDATSKIREMRREKDSAAPVGSPSKTSK